MNEDTVFEKIIRGELPAKVVHEDENVIAFEDINPQAPVHVLVIPKKKILSFDQVTDLDTQYAGLYFQGISTVAKKLNLSEGYRVVFNTGKHGQQTVNYIHAHIMGKRQMQWPPG